MTKDRTPLTFGVDAGGTSTRLCRDKGGEIDSFRFGSINPASVGEDAALSTLFEILTAARSSVDLNITAKGHIASAAVGFATLDVERARVQRAAEMAGGTWEIRLTGDVAPLLWAPPLCGNGIALVAGTGSCAVARWNGRVVIAGGYEYLASDEGGAFTIGLNGIRAAARAFDGRGPDTSLLAAIREMFGANVPEIGRALAASAFPKASVASFAEVVVRAWENEDPVSASIVQDAVAALGNEARTAMRTVECSDDADIVVTGGLITGSTRFCEEVENQVRLLGVTGRMYVVEDASSCALECNTTIQDIADLAPLPSCVIEVQG